MVDDERHFQCSVYDLLNRYGFMEGESLIPEEKPLVKKACEYLAHNLGEIEQRWQPTVSQKSQHYVTFFDAKEERYVNFYQMEEIDRRKIQAILDKKNLNWITVDNSQINISPLKHDITLDKETTMSIAQPTLDDVWKLFQETDKKFQESDRKWQQMREEMREMSKETNEKIKEVSTEVGRLGNKLGDFIEEMLYPAAVRLFKDRGIEVHEVQRNVSAHRNGEGIEVDLLVVNDTVAVAIECKSSLSIDDVNEHLERMDKLKRVLPAHANKKVMGAVTGMIIPDNVAQYAYKKGLFVIGQTGEQLVVRNDLKFKAKIW